MRRCQPIRFPCSLNILVIEEGIIMLVIAEMSELMSSLGRELKEGTPIMQTVHKLQKLLPHFQIFIDQFESCKKDSKTYQLWCNYLHMIEILLSYIHAERSGEWQERLSATAEMAEYIAAADHTKYIKALMCYLNEMGSLQTETPEIYEAFEHGYFTVKRSSGEFNAMWTDMALECSQNCEAKGRSDQAGLKGITMNKNAQTRWFKTLSFSDAISTLIRVMAHMHTQDEFHYEGSSATKKRQCNSLDHIISVIESDQIINPFVYGKKYLVSIADGSVATEQISDDLLELKKHGKKSIS